MTKSILLIFIILFIISCKKETRKQEPFELVPVNKFDGKGYISYDNKVIFTQRAAHILHEKYSKNTFCHIILAGRNSYKLFGDFDYTKYYTDSNFLRISFKSDTFLYPDNLVGKYNLDYNKINIIKIFDVSLNSFLIDTIVDGEVVIYIDPSISNIPIYKFSGTSKIGKLISSECIQSVYYTSYKLLRKVKGNINYCDSNICLSISRIINGTSIIKTLELADYYNNYKVWLEIPITVNNIDISGTYTYNNSNNLKMMFYNCETKKYSYIFFNSGTITIIKELLVYKIDFNFTTTSNNILIGNWNGELSR